MSMQQQCVVCAKPLPTPRRADARYCRSPSTCRVQAYRARKPRDVTAVVLQPTSRRRPSPDAAATGARTTTQLATFRALRREQKRAAQAAAQAERDALVAARQEIERLQASLQETRALVETQRAVATRDAARGAEEQQRATKLAQEQSQAVEEARRDRDAAQKHADDLAEQLQQRLERLTRERDKALLAAAARRQELTTERQQHTKTTAERDEARAYIVDVLPVLRGLAPAPAAPMPTLSSEPTQASPQNIRLTRR